jgi:hypothetical protein
VRDVPPSPPLPSIHNFTSQPLDADTISLLSLGVKFAISRPLTSDHLLKDLADFVRRARLTHFFLDKDNNDNNLERNIDFRLYVRRSRFIPPPASPQLEAFLHDLQQSVLSTLTLDLRLSHLSNLSPGQYRAFTQLRLNNSLHITPTDKNLGFAVFDRSRYLAAVDLHVSDTHFYEQIPPSSNPQSIIDALHEEYFTSLLPRLPPSFPFEYSRFLSHRGTPEFHSFPIFYLLPKIHKNPIQWRPIVASTKWITSGLSLWLSIFLLPFLERTPSYLRDTPSLLHILENTPLPHDCILVSADYASLYTNLPLQDVCTKIRTFLLTSEVDPTTVEFVWLALRFVLLNNYFITNGKIFRQKHGIAMGTPLAPVLASLYLYIVETTSPFNDALLFKRYIDDIILIWPGHRRTALTELLNNVKNRQMHADLTISYDISANEITFLDTIIFKGPRFNSCNLLDVRLYTKPLNSFLYLPPSSCHPPHTFRSWPFTELRRILRNTSCHDTYTKSVSQFKKHLHNRGYSHRFLRRLHLSYHLRPTLLSSSHGSTHRHSPPLLLKTTYSHTNPLPAIFHTTINRHPSAFQSGDFMETGNDLRIPRPIIAYRVLPRLWTSFRHYLPHHTTSSSETFKL